MREMPPPPPSPEEIQDRSRFRSLLFLTSLPSDDFARGLRLSVPPVDVPTRERSETEQGKELSEEEVVELMQVALAWTEDFWSEEFKKQGLQYEATTLVVPERGMYFTPCGPQHTAMSPVYCPRNKKLYVSPDFFVHLQERYYKDATDMSMAYVIFHEVSHHVQTLLGTHQELVEGKGRYPSHANIFNTAFELQAEYLAGCAIKKMNERDAILHEDDIESMYWTLVAVGDDVSQMRARGNKVDISSITHGTARARAEALWTGFHDGDALNPERDISFFIDVAKRMFTEEISRANKVA